MVADSGIPSSKELIPEPVSPKNTYFRWLLVFLCLFVIGAFCAYQWSQKAGFMRVKQVRCSGLRLVSQKELLKVAGIAPNMQITALKPAAIQERLERHPYIRAANVSRHFPDQVWIAIEERVPFCYIAISQLYLIDGTGVLLPLPSRDFKANFPIITGFERDSSTFRPGRRSSNPYLRQALLILQTAQQQTPDFFSNISELHHHQQGEFILFTIDAGTPIYLRRGNYAKQLAIIAQFQRKLQFRRTFADYKYIDLRWDKQIVVKERNS
jgi:cell division protein FtsQ